MGPKLSVQCLKLRDPPPLIKEHPPSPWRVEPAAASAWKPELEGTDDSI